MQKRGTFKKFSVSIYWTQFFNVYISVKGTYLAYLCEQIVEVTSL